MAGLPRHPLSESVYGQIYLLKIYDDVLIVKNALTLLQDEQKEIKMKCAKCGNEMELAGNVRAVGTAVGAGAGAWTGAAACFGAGVCSGAKAGTALGLVMGPAGVAAGAIAGGILGALGGMLFGGALGSKAGDLVDKHIIQYYRCPKCGNAYSNH